jgi:NADH-quinone oxidoreductase subunit D
MSDLVFEDEFGEELSLNMGPQHPSTHGVLRFVVKADGEVMKRAIPDVGYLHRSIEKIAEKMTWPGFMPYTDRVDYLAAMFCNEGWAVAVERLMGQEVPERAEYLRVISCELNRIASHLIAVGTMAMDIGALTPFPYALRERETINDLIEELCGARLTYNYHRIGGVAWDMPKGWYDKCLRFLDHFEPTVEEFDRLITGNEIFVQRLANVGVVPLEMAVDYGLVGPNLRASGLDYDVRRDEAYSVYPKLQFEVPVGRGMRGTVGDSYDRYFVRVREMAESAKIIRQCFDQMPQGPFKAKTKKKLKVPAGEVVVRIESARGEMTWYVVSDGGEKAYRCHVRTGSFNAMGIIEPLSEGVMIADLVALIASFDVVAPEIDR